MKNCKENIDAIQIGSKYLEKFITKENLLLLYGHVKHLDETLCVEFLWTMMASDLSKKMFFFFQNFDF
jgi:hypothetical protein